MKLTGRIFAALLSVSLLIIIFNGCKKQNTGTPERQTMQPALDALRERYKNTPLTTTQILNMPGKGFWADETGKQIFARTSSPNRIEACPDPGEDYPSQSVYSVLREFTCGQGYRIEVKYDVILAYTPQLTNGLGTASFGRVWLFNSGGTRIWPTVTPTPKHNVLTIDNLGSAGTDPNGLPLTKYRVTFRTDYIPEGTFAASTSMQTYLSVYTDCVNYPTFVCPFSTQQSAITSQQDAYPCTRIDVVYWNPSFGLGAQVAGVNTIPSSCFPWGYVFPDWHEVQIFKDGAWEPLKLWRWKASPPPPPGDPKEYSAGLLNSVDLWYIRMDSYNAPTTTIPTGTYPIRYRNKQTTGVGNPCVTQPDGTWVNTNWYLSI